MAKQTLLRWIALLKKPQDSLSQNDFNVFVISDCQSPNEVSPLLKQYFPNFIINKKLKDFSLWQLIFGSLHFAGHPSKKNLSFYEKLKRIIVRVFFTNYERATTIWNLVDLVFLSHSKNSLFTPGEHVTHIYKTHFPDYTVKELSSYSSKTRNFLIYILALISRKKFQDIKEGVTVFCNTIDPFLLKSYRLLHPRKNVYIRFHDILEQITTRTDFPKVKEMLHELIKKNIIHGAESYYEPDAIFLDILYRPNAVNSEVMRNVNYNFRNYFYTFIGAQKSGKDQFRLNDLKKIHEQLCYIYPSIPKYINEYIILDNEFKIKSIPYSEYLNLIGQSEIVIDMYRIAPDEGLSFRIFEALQLGRKVITNRLIILKYDFYDPSRFFVIGYDSIERLGEFITNDFKCLPEEILKRYDCSNWWKKVIK